MDNPFEAILEKLNRIELILAELMANRNAGKEPVPHNDEWMTAEGAAIFLHVSTGSIYRYVMIGTLPKTKFGNKLYFKREQLEKLIEKSN